MTPEERKEWLALRHKCVSSTESSALFGLNPYMTAFELAVVKKSAEPEDSEGTERMEWGKRLQRAIAGGIEQEYGVIAMPLPQYIKKPGARMGSSFDYQIVGRSDLQPGPRDAVLQDMFANHGPGILEIKNVDSLEYKNKWSEEAPEHIEVQLQHQLEVIGNGWGVIAALIGGNRAEIIPRERDTEVGRSIVSKVTQFWQDLEAGIMPPLVMPEDAAALIKLYQFASANKLYDGRDNAELATLCAEYQKASAAEKAFEGVKKVAHARILEIIGDAEKALVQGYSISAGMVAGAVVSYTRNPYRGFRLTQKKAKANGKDAQESTGAAAAAPE